MKKIFFFIFFLLAVFSFSQTNIKVMSYNLLDFPIPLPNDRLPYLKNILDNIKPDIFMVCELGSEDAANSILNTALQTPDNRYTRAAFVANTSSSYQDLQQLVFYNSQKLLLTAQAEIPTGVRDINHYTFKLKTENSATNPIYLEVFVAHLKSSTGTSNELSRFGMVTDFTDALTHIPNNHFVLFGGDFNLYTSTEQAYQRLLDVTNAIVMVDPINRPGSWSDNSSFTDIHTQSTRNSSFTDGLGNFFGAGGYLDDRFDFILMSQNLQTSTDLHYVTNTYKAFGNNGNCYNKSINNTSCTGTYSQSIRNDLYNMSDHLPVVMELETPENTLAINSQTLVSSVNFIKGNLITDWLELQINSNFEAKNIKIYNQLGQVVFNKTTGTSKTLKYNLSNLKPGVYYLKIDDLSSIKPLKFIKLP